MKTSLATLVLLLVSSPAICQTTIALDTAQTFQTIEGWGHGGGIFSNLNYGLAMTDRATGDSLNYQYLDYIANDLGLTSSRMWEVGPCIDGTGIDVDGDC